jgi:ACS family hexuronate transporter-like MFS transporter
MGFWQRTRALRWWIIAIVMLGTIINYLVRAARSAWSSRPRPSMADVPMTEEQYSWITAVFQAFIMLQPVVGYILDTIGLRTGMAMFATGWGLLTFAHGWVISWQRTRGAARRAGLRRGHVAHRRAEGRLRMVSVAKERGHRRAASTISAPRRASRWPAPIVAIAIDLVELARGLRTSREQCSPCCGSCSGCFYYRPPEEHPDLRAEERAHIRSGQEAHVQAAGARPSILSLLRQRNFWGIALPASSPTRPGPPDLLAPALSERNPRLQSRRDGDRGRPALRRRRYRLPVRPQRRGARARAPRNRADRRAALDLHFRRAADDR